MFLVGFLEKRHFWACSFCQKNRHARGMTVDVLKDGLFLTVLYSLKAMGSTTLTGTA
jgi:hypothetical protein